MYKKRLIAGILILVMFVGIAVSPANAQTGDTSLVGSLMAKIQTLLSEVFKLQSEVNNLNSSQAAATFPALSSSGYVCTKLTAYQKVGVSDANTSGEVSELQKVLKDYGVFNEEITGYFGEVTKTALISFQVGEGLSGSGTVGDNTRAKIEDLTCGDPAVPEPTIIPNPSPSVTVIYPNGGESINAGSRYTITWDYNPGDANSDGKINIDDYGVMDGDPTYNDYHKVNIALVSQSGNTTIASNIPARTGNYSWTVPNTTAGGQYTIQITGVFSSKQGTYSDSSNAPFAINAYTPPSVATVTLTLVNADTEADIMPLTNGTTLNFATLPTRNLNVRADTNPSTVTNVQFNYDGVVKTEQSKPYALGGDNAGNYNAWTPSIGSHTLIVTPYVNSTAGTVLNVAFSVVDTTPQNPPTVSLTASPSTITSGSASTLTWSSTNATSCSASGDWSGGRATSGTQTTGSLTASKTYTLTCTGNGGSASRSATVTVNQPTTGKFKIGDRVVATANINVRTSPGVLTDNKIGTNPNGSLGTVLEGPIAATSYVWWKIDYDSGFDGWSGEDNLALAPNPSAPTLSLSASPTSIASGGSSTLSWSSANTTSCTASGGWSGTKATSGSESTGILTSDKTYTLSCVGPAGSISRSVTVTVSTTPPPPPPPGDRPGLHNTGPATCNYMGAKPHLPSCDTVLKKMSSLTITQPGAVIENVHVTGKICIDASNVTLRNFIAETASDPVIKIGCATGSFTGILIEDGATDGLGASGNGVSGSNYTVRRLHVHNMGSDGFRFNKNNVVEYSYVHDLHKASNAHADAIQRYPVGAENKNFIVRGNYFDLTGASAGIFHGNNGFIIENNWFYSKPSWTKSDGTFRATSNEGINGEDSGDRKIIRGNKFSKYFRYNMAGINTDSAVTWENNTLLESGKTMTLQDGRRCILGSVDANKNYTHSTWLCPHLD